MTGGGPKGELMRTWHYERGKWTEIPSPFDAGASLAQELEVFGFKKMPIFSLGDTDRFGVQVYAHDDSGVNIEGAYPRVVLQL